MLQVYTGDGKGKTTAAIGLAVRSIGAGRQVYIMQFMKSLAYSEQTVLAQMKDVTLKTTGKPCFIAPEGLLTEEQIKAFGDGVVVFPPGQPPADYVELIAQGLKEARQDIIDGGYGLVILDEINMALYFGLVSRSQVEKLLEAVGESTEVVCTGRRAPQWLMDRADLVTEMKEIKHYYQQGIEARKGIEC